VEGQYRHLSFRITLLACAIGVMCPLDMEGAFAAVPHSRTFAAVPDSRALLATDVEREPPRSPNLIHDPFCAAVFAPPEGRASLTPEMIEEALSSIREPVFTSEKGDGEKSLIGMVNCQCECNCACNACGDCAVSCGMCDCPCAACNACDTCDCCGGAWLARKKGWLSSRRSL